MNVLRLLSMLALFSSLTQAADWPHWRGPLYNGSTGEKNLPARWSTTENIAWTADLPGPGACTPVVWGDHVFLSAADRDRNMLVALALDRKSGKLLWQHDIAEGISRTRRSNFASPSPTTDGKVVVFFYGSGDLAGFDVAGTKLWQRNIQNDYGAFAFLWTFASTPLLYEGKLYLQVLQRDVPVRRGGRRGGGRSREGKIESYLLAMDPMTGKELWKHSRPSKAQAESRESFSSPIPYEKQGRKELLIVGGDAMTGHDPATGKELWRWGTWNPSRIGHWRHVPSPVANEDVVLVCAPKREPVYAIKTGESGQLGKNAVAWISEEDGAVTSDVPTPALYDGDFFVLSDLRKNLTRVNPATGAVKWKLDTPGRAKYEASPLAADGKIYLINFDGEAVVVNAADGTIQTVIPMNPAPGYPIRSSISAAHGRLFIRANRTLYCVGKK
jgi:outer membrane protein assembly factor BamB